jgi:hypothetical protein
MAESKKHSRKPSNSSSGGVFNKKNRWLLWVGVALMILAMIGYIMSLDESVSPEEMTELSPVSES